MRMVQVEYHDGCEWIPCIREDLLELMDGRQPPPALFYTTDEARRFISTMCELIHCGGHPSDFRILDVLFDGVTIEPASTNSNVNTSTRA